MKTRNISRWILIVIFATLVLVSYSESPERTCNEGGGRDDAPSPGGCSVHDRPLMKGITVSEFGGPEVLKVRYDIPIPQPTDTEVLIKVLAAGVNPVETYIRNGTHKFRPKLPWIPGQDVAGTIESVGSSVKSHKVGDRVYARLPTNSGAYAEFAVAPEDKTHRIPDHISFQQGAAIGIPYFTAYNALFQRTNSKPGESVLVHGASGATGLACVQFAYAHGMTVYGTAGTQEGLDLVTRNGAVKVFNHRDENYTTEIMKATNERGVDVVMEMLANVNLQKDMEMLAEYGRIALVGSRASIEIIPRTLMTKMGSIVGIRLKLTEEEYKEIAASIDAGLVNKYLIPRVGLEYPLEQADEAHREVIEHKKGTQGKIVLTL
ncbi:quinone oxidoreductase-like [Glandiceps talaboti]